MTMNIMSVSVPASSPLGSSAMGKSTTTHADSANGSAGLFGEVFSQESESQAAQDSAAPATKVKDIATSEIAAAADAQTQLDAEIDAEGDAEISTEGNTTATQQVPTQSADSTAESDSNVEQEGDDATGIAQSTFAPLNLTAEQSAAIESIEVQADKRLTNGQASEKITLSSQPDADSEANNEAAKRQGGSGLPPEFAASATKTATNIEPAAKSQLLGDRVFTENAIKETATANESGLKGTAGVTAQASILNNTQARAAESANTVVQINDKTAQILAEYADVKIQTQAGEPNAKAEQHARATNMAPDLVARTAAPEWLAQIEHGKRWSSTPSKADVNAQAADADRLSLTLGEKTSAARAINAALNKSASANAESTESISLSVANAGSGLSQPSFGQEAVSTQTNGQDASVFLSNRESSLLAATPERTAMLDKALTLHGSAEQNAKQLAQQAQVIVSQNLQEAEIKLNPSEFGAMRIQVRIEQGEVQVQFVASHPQARDLLDQALPRLREMLQQQGMNLHQGQQQSGQQQAGQQGQQAQSQANASVLSQGFGQGNSESGQQQDSQTGAENANTEWRSYSATGDEVQEQALNSSQRALYGADGAKIDFFA